MTPPPPFDPALKPPGHMTLERIEGQLIAHRNLLTLILSDLRRRDGAAELMASLDSLSVMQDHQEDPGATISAAAAIEGALAREIAAVLEASSTAETSQDG